MPLRKRDKIQEMLRQMNLRCLSLYWPVREVYPVKLNGSGIYE
jgi:hypothetical protein